MARRPLEEPWVRVGWALLPLVETGGHPLLQVVAKWQNSFVLYYVACTSLSGGLHFEK